MGPFGPLPARRLVTTIVSSKIPTDVCHETGFPHRRHCCRLRHALRDRRLRILAVAVADRRRVDRPHAGLGAVQPDVADRILLAAYDLHQVFEGATLHLNGTANVTYTFVGKEAGYTNVFKSFYSGYGGSFQQIVGSIGNLGQSISFSNVVNSALKYGFLSNGAGSLDKNSDPDIGVALSTDKKSALIFFNDSCKCDKDYDDMVIKVSIAAVPEPETYAMLLAGLGIMGGIARRRRTKA